MSRSQRSAVSLFLGIWSVIAGLGFGVAGAEDWPMFRHDLRRSGATGERIDARRLAPAWVYRSPQPPQPAWAGAADVDAFRKQRGLGDMRRYDSVDHCVVAGDAVFCGSSADDAVRCLDLATGMTRWRHTTGGPIRVPPTVAAGLVFFGSDDGTARAVDAATGRLTWRFRPPAPRQMLIHDGRLVSQWPCRTGVAVIDGTAVFGMSMLPWKPTYLCAVAAATGQPTGHGGGVRRFEDGYTLEAALLATDGRLIAPQGRAGVSIFDTATLEPAGAVSGASSFATITREGVFISGPFSRDIGLRGTSLHDPSVQAWHSQAVACVADGDDVFMLSAGGVSAGPGGDPAAQRWQVSLVDAGALAVAADTVFAGCDGSVVALDRRTGAVLWRAAVEGRALGLAVANGAVLVSTDFGRIHCFRTTLAEPASPPEPAAVAESPPPASAPAAGLPERPFLEWRDAESVLVHWRTATPQASAVRFRVVAPAADWRHSHDPAAVTEHVAVLDDLPGNRTVNYEILDPAAADAVLHRGSIDTHFNYGASPWPAADDAGSPETTAAAVRILAASGAEDGIALVVGGTAAERLAWDLARQSRLRVVLFDDDAKRVEDVRERWQLAGAYGGRLSAIDVPSLADTGLPGMIATVIAVSENVIGARLSLAEAARLLRPETGCLVHLAGAAEAAPAEAAGLRVERREDGMLLARRGPLAGSAAWTHQYGAADNAGYAGETLAGVRAANDLDVQWIGRPGPRDHADRMVRHPAPLVAAGRLFIQGQERLVTLDAATGVPLWSLEVPGLERYDIPHDAGNWAADARHVFVAVDGQCWQLSADRGRVVSRFDPVPGVRPGASWDWGYVAVDGPRLVGTANLRAINAKGWWGGEYWRDDEVNTVVVSDSLFAIDPASGGVAWSRTGSAIVNCSITLAGGKAFFLECRDPPTLAGHAGRIMLHDDFPGLHLVAVDTATGRTEWEQPFAMVGGRAMFSMAWADGTLVTCSSENGTFHVEARRAADGRRLWTRRVPWGGRGHGGHYSRPVIVDGRVIVRPHVLALVSGKPLPGTMPGGGCGTYCASRDAVFFRSGDSAVWSPASGQFSSFSRLRPGCWLSAVPAAGLLLSPEAGGGCSCGGWLETSIAFAPARRPAVSFGTRERSFIDGLELGLFNRVAGCTIRYTLDGSEPDERSAAYAAPIHLDRSATVRTAAWFAEPAGGSARSETVTATFTRRYPAPVIESGTTVFTDTLTVPITRTGTTGEIRYTLDGSDPTGDSPPYREPIVIDATADVAARGFWTHADGTPAAGDVTRQRFLKVTRRLPDVLAVNFQTRSAPVPEGYVIDAGETFRPQPDGCFYGWTVDMRDRLGGRGDAHDPLRNTFIHCKADAAWELEVADGRYEVTVCVGETFYGQERATIFVEGVEFCRDLRLNRKETRDLTRVVEVTDGRLTLTSHEDSRINKATRLNHLRLRRAGGSGPGDP